MRQEAVHEVCPARPHACHCVTRPSVHWAPGLMHPRKVRADVLAGPSAHKAQLQTANVAFR